MRTVFLAVAAVGAALAAAAPASADTDWYFNAADFAALGTLQSPTDFDTFGSAITLLSNNETFGPFTFSGDDLFIAGPDSYLAPVRNVISTQHPDFNLDISVDVGGYNMLAFDIGNFGSLDAQVFLSLTTNVDTYYYGMLPGLASQGLGFYGFVASPGEYFTSLEMNHTELGQAYGLTNLRLGKTGPVVGCRDTSQPCTGSAAPEPASWALMILGFGAAGAAFRARRRAAVA